MKWFKSKLRKRVEFHIEMAEDSLTAINKEIEVRKLKRTLNPSEYSKFIVMRNDIQEDIKLLKDLL